MNINNRVAALAALIEQRQRAGLDTRRLESELRQAQKDQQRSNGRNVKQQSRNLNAE